MESSTEKSGLNYKYYLIQEKLSIEKLHTLLYKNPLWRKIKQVISIVFEIILVLVFVAFVYIIMYLPLDPIHMKRAISDSTSVEATVHNDDITAMMIILKTGLFLLSLMPLIMMLLLRRNRLKSTSIYEACEEIESMRKRSDLEIKKMEL